jgi:hypothetical protein
MSFPIGRAVSGIARIALVAVAALAIPAVARGQAAGAATEAAPVCYRFAFGAWTPALDRAAAGHDPAARAAGTGAPNGRDWAVDDFGGGATLMLFPAWWPAGVSVTLRGPAPAVGDTASGTATALVADGRKQAPVAPIRVMGVSCGGPGPADGRAEPAP